MQESGIHQIGSSRAAFPITYLTHRLEISIDIMHLKLKIGIANSLQYAGVLAFAGNAFRRHNDLILTLHRVLPPAVCRYCYDKHMVISTTAFEDLLIYLRNNCEIVSLNTLMSDRRPPSNVQRIAITFDDGWQDTFTYAFPLLIRYQIPATVFICTSLLGSSAILPEERLVRIFNHCIAKHCIPSFFHHLMAWGGSAYLSTSLDWRSFTKALPMSAKLSLASHLEIVYGLERISETNFMSWHEVQTMFSSGIEVGSHTANHVTLNAENNVVIERELRDSRELITTKLGSSPRYLSYPNGGYNQGVVLLAKEIGYTHAFTTQHGSFVSTGEPFTIPRVAIDNTLLTDKMGRLHTARTALHLSPLRTFLVGLHS